VPSLQPPVTAVNNGIGLKKRQHSLDVSCPLSGNQQPLEILRIARWFTVCFI
jgi:hypothetical protein